MTIPTFTENIGTGYTAVTTFLGLFYDDLTAVGGDDRLSTSGTDYISVIGGENIMSRSDFTTDAGTFETYLTKAAAYYSDKRMKDTKSIYVYKSWLAAYMSLQALEQFLNVNNRGSEFTPKGLSLVVYLLNAIQTCGNATDFDRLNAIYTRMASVMNLGNNFTCIYTAGLSLDRNVVLRFADVTKAYFTIQTTRQTDITTSIQNKISDGVSKSTIEAALTANIANIKTGLNGMINTLKLNYMADAVNRGFTAQFNDLANTTAANTAVDELITNAIQNNIGNYLLVSDKIVVFKICINIPKYLEIDAIERWYNVRVTFDGLD
jgi:hypothetical protein